jgi:hypothetical protein
MPFLTWSKMMERHPACHLVVGVHSVDKINRALLLRSLIETLGVTGAFAVRRGRAGGEQIVQVAFAKKEDAERLAEVVGARRTGPSGWASRRVFGFGKDVVARIERALATDA